MSDPAKGTVTLARNRDLAATAGRALLARGWRVVTAESCTGGGIAAALTDIPGSSQWFERGYVTYSNLAKQQDLQVSASTLEVHGAVSSAVVLAMAAGALEASGAELALSVSGVAGPDGGTATKPVGLVWFALARRGAPGRSEMHQFPGDRAAVRLAAVHRALELINAAASAPVS
jgi:nicotinamide-nucleotide amidase